MVTVNAPRRRRRRDDSLGQIPLSSGEIEMYSRQDEVARRRRRLLAVRDQERRLAQQVTQRYRNNLQKLQRGKSHEFQKQLSLEQWKLLTELYLRYENSVQNMGTAQRSARIKLLELMEQAQEEKNKWTYNQRLVGKQRAIEAEEDQKAEEAMRTARRRQMELNMERLKLRSGQQRQRASARAQRKQDAARERGEEQETIETLRRMQSCEEVFVTPKTRQNDVMAYQFTRTHCLSTRILRAEKPAVRVIRHGRNKSIMRRGEDEAMKYRVEADQRRERNRLIMEEQQEAAKERGKDAFEKAASKEQGHRAMEWLALVDKLERRARGQELGGGESCRLNAVDVRMDDQERRAEQAFAQMLGFNEDSAELSAFCIDTDDDRAVALVDSSHELLDDDGTVKDSVCVDLLDGIESSRNDRGEQQAEGMKATTLGDLQREELKTHTKSKDMRKRDVRTQGSDSEEVLDSSAGRLSTQSLEDGRSREQKSRMAIDTQLFRAEHDQYLSSKSASNTSVDESFHEKIRARDGGDSVMDDEDQRSVSESSSAFSQESLDQVSIDVAFKARPEDQEDELEGNAGRLVGASFQERSIGERKDKKRSESKSSGKISAARDCRLSSSNASEDEKESVELDFGQPVENRDFGIHVPVEVSNSQWNERTTRGDQRTSGATRHGINYDNSDDRSESMRCKGEAIGSTFHESTTSQSLRTGEVSEKISQNTLDHGRGRLSVPSAQETVIDKSAPRQISTTETVRASMVRDDDSSSATSHSSDAGNDKKDHVFDAKVFRDVDEEVSSSDSSFAPSQRSLSCLDHVANERAKSLEQKFMDRHVMSFSGSEEPSEGEAETESHRPCIDSVHSSVNSRHNDPYRQQIHQQARRSSTSAVSVAQYSLPPSDAQSSFDESLDQLHAGHSDDSFVNELVPMFPKRTLQAPSRSLDDDNEALEEYYVQLVAPNMSRMLTSERLASFDQSRQRLAHKTHQTAATSREPSSSMATQTRKNSPPIPSDKRAFASRNSSGSSSFELDRESLNTTVQQSPVRQHVETEQRWQVTNKAEGLDSCQSRDKSKPQTRALSDISSRSGVSSLGFAVELNIAAGTSRRREQHAQECCSDDDEVDKQSVVSEQSFASSSSLSMDAHFKYLAKMTSAVGKALPLQLRLPAMIYGEKDMTKPPAPMAWSASSVSSVASGSEVDSTEGLQPTAKRSISRPDSNWSDSLLEEQRVCPQRTTHRAHGRDSYACSSRSGQSEKSDDERTRENRSGKARNTVQSPTRRQHFDSSADGFEACVGQHTDDSQRHHVLPPPPRGFFNMKQPPAPMQNAGYSTDDSQSSSEQHFKEQPLERQNARRHSRDLRDAMEENKQDDVDCESRRSSYSDAASNSRCQSMKKAEKLVIPLTKSRDDNGEECEEDQEGKEMSLAEAFQRRHPAFGRRLESHRDKLKRQRDMQQQQQRQSEYEDAKTSAKHDTDRRASSRCHSTAAPLPPEKQELLDRLASGSRAKISSREMKERSRRLYHQLPEVVERKRQEEIMRRRRQRLDELREQEKERRLQQKQRRQEQQMRQHAQD